jgi:bifunctional DNase/RNase
MEDLIRVTVRESALDLGTGQYKVVLYSSETGQVLSIWVGHCEGSAIAMGLESAWTPRPMTHDLLAQTVKSLGASVVRVVITDVRDNTFLAVLCLEKDGQELMLDSRPSDAIALALRTRAPIFVSSHLADAMADELDDLFQQLEPKDTVH